MEIAKNGCNIWESIEMCNHPPTCAKNLVKRMVLLTNYLEKTDLEYFAESLVNWKVELESHIGGRCICGHDLELCYIIKNIITKDKCYIGCECIKRIIPKAWDIYNNQVKICKRGYCLCCDKIYVNLSTHLRTYAHSERAVKFHKQIQIKLIGFVSKHLNTIKMNKTCKKCIGCKKWIDKDPEWAIRCKTCYRKFKYTS